MKKTALLLVLVGAFALSVTSAAFAGASAPNLELFSEAFIGNSLGQDDSNYPAALGSFEITSGLVKDSEVTFDSERIIVGSAPKDTSVSIEIFRWDSDNYLFEPFSYYEFNVGASGIFSQNIELGLGGNYILVTATCDNQTMVLPKLINRKSAEIKRELEKGIVLPGTAYQ